MASNNAIKVVIMGQGGVGKTAMVLKYTTGEFSEEYMPTIGDMYTKDVEVNGMPRHITIDDTAGQEAFADLKREKITTGDGYILCFSITDDTTFAKLDRLHDEIRSRHPRGAAVPIFLVGTKSDLEEDRAVAQPEITGKARKWNSQTYSCSSKTGTNVSLIFNKLIQSVLAVNTDPTKGGGGGSVMGAGMKPATAFVPEPKKKSRCTIL